MSVKTKHSAGRSLGSHKWGRHQRKEFQFLSNMFLVEQSWERIHSLAQPAVFQHAASVLGAINVSIP